MHATYARISEIFFIIERIYVQKWASVFFVCVCVQRSSVSVWLCVRVWLYVCVTVYVCVCDVFRVDVSVCAYECASVSCHYK